VLKAHTQRILENLNTTVLLVDAQLKLRSINPAGELLFEISARQIVGQALGDLLPNNPALIDAMRQALATGHPFTEHGLHLLLSGKRDIAIDCTVTPLTDNHGKSELLLEWVPIDRLLRLAREENMLDQHAVSRALIRGLAHEIKNPLGGLRGAAQLLERQLPDKALKEYTRIIIHEADRLRNLVDRMVGPNAPLKKQAVNIHQVFEHVRSLMLAEIPNGIAVHRDYDPSIPEFSADPEQLIQAVLNVVRNAAQALNNAGDITLRTRIERQHTIGHQRHRLVLRAEIEDNGPGIPDELREHIFYPMVTGRAEGTGLGLSIAQVIIHQHGGSIECTSRPQQTVFKIYLPLENGHG
jgi:two-component system, NtrC family, nitrogen regulation sensor histidine kinase GlnL